MKSRSVSKANKRRDARRARHDSMKLSSKGERAFKRPGSRNPHKGA